MTSASLQAAWGFQITVVDGKWRVVISTEAGPVEFETTRRALEDFKDRLDKKLSKPPRIG